MPILQLRDLRLGYGGPPVLDNIELGVEPGERIALIGRNGAGKSTLLRFLAGELEPEGGTRSAKPGLRVATLPQQVPDDMIGTVEEEVARDRLGEAPAADEMARTRRIAETLSRMDLDPDASCAEMSAGMKRRVLLARALSRAPDLLLLDEPTNHLDVDAIEWLEGFLIRHPAALVFVSHDRAFMRRLATRIVVVDRGRVKSYPGDYSTFERRRESDLAAEEVADRERDKKLAKEEVWAKQGIKARRTRSEGRVRALEALREERRARRKRVGSAKLEVAEASRSGTLVIEATDVTFGYDDTPMIRDFSAAVMRGDKIGVLGQNGAGKSTLLRLLLKELEPQSGTVRHGTKLEVGYFDQLRRGLDEDLSVHENVTDTDWVFIGERKRHIITYLEEFLFESDRVRDKVRHLSGGEKNRLLLAKLLARQVNLLVLDEPTNDLDTETLELLEERLVDFGGTLLLVSHDREFLNNVCTSVLALDGDGHVEECAGGYDDWKQRHAARAAAAAPDRTPKRAKSRPKGTSPPADHGPRRRTYGEQIEYDQLPDRIETLEERRRTLHEEMAAPGFYEGDPARAERANQELSQVESDLAQTYARWEELEELAS